MDGRDPLSTRDELKLCLPDWFVDWVLAPFPDEVGYPLVYAKWSVFTFLLLNLLTAWIPAQFDEQVGISMIVTGLGIMLWARFAP
jgi:hypothetical protein